MIKNHKYIIELSDKMNDGQRALFYERIILEVINDITKMWPSVTLTESKDDELI